MSIKIQCPECGKVNSLDNLNSGPTRDCSFCGAAMPVPMCPDGPDAPAGLTASGAPVAAPAPAASAGPETTTTATTPQRPRRRVSLFSDGGFILAMLAGAAILAAGYIVANYGKGDQISEIVAKASSAPTGAAKKKDAEVKKAATAEEKRRKEYKPQWLKIKGTGYGFDRKPDFVIDKQKNVIPSNVERKAADVWKGPADLSMKIWLGHDAQFLYVRIVGADDVQHQKLSGENQGLWMDDSAQFMLWANGWNTQWEFTVALGEDGKPAYAIHLVPNKQSGHTKEISQANFAARREGGVTTYDVKLPLKTLGLTDKDLRNGFRFNALLNDTDDAKNQRKCWIEIVEGIASHKDVFASPWIKFEK